MEKANFEIDVEDTLIKLKQLQTNLISASMSGFSYTRCVFLRKKLFIFIICKLLGSNKPKEDFDKCFSLFNFAPFHVSRSSRC